MKTPSITYQNKLFNSKVKKSFRRDLRESATTLEQILWKSLRNRKYLNLKFRRQYGIGRYIVDFYCPELKLVIEIDGANHFFDDKSTKYDTQRQKYIEAQNIRVIRFPNADITDNLDGVMQTIGEFKASP